MWTIDEAVELLERRLPNRSVIIADGEADYLVKTIADTVKSTPASFQQLWDSVGKQLRRFEPVKGRAISEKDRLCSERSDKPAYSKPDCPSRRAWSVWGLIGNCEVWISRDLIETC